MLRSGHGDETRVRKSINSCRRLAGEEPEYGTLEDERSLPLFMRDQNATLVSPAHDSAINMKWETSFPKFDEFIESFLHKFTQYGRWNIQYAREAASAERNYRRAQMES